MNSQPLKKLFALAMEKDSLVNNLKKKTTCIFPSQPCGCAKIGGNLLYQIHSLF